MQRDARYKAVGLSRIEIKLVHAAAAVRVAGVVATRRGLASAAVTFTAVGVSVRVGGSAVVSPGVRVLFGLLVRVVIAAAVGVWFMLVR